MCCDCWWCNWCGIICGGVHNAFCVCSYWLCKPLTFREIDPDCCHLCACDGWGYNCFCWGNVCCAPKTVAEWSGLHTAGIRKGDNSDRAIVVMTNNPYGGNQGFN